MFGTTQSTFSTVVFGLVGVINLLTWLLSGIALLIFLWGVVRFISHGADKDAYKEGKQLMFWGILALFIIFSLTAILYMMCGALLGNSSYCINTANIPT